MRCPHCGKRSVISHVTVRWNQVKGSFLPSRGHYCTACKTAFEDERAAVREFTFQSVRIDAMTEALRRLQESADVIVVRHRSGVREVVF
jgi:Ni,Fe-hydrogenase I small subunit